MVQQHLLIRFMKTAFVRHGIPNEIVADNVPYNSWEFHEFGKQHFMNLGKQHFCSDCCVAE